MNGQELQANVELFFLDFYKLSHKKIYRIDVKATTGRDLPGFGASVCLESLKALKENFAHGKTSFDIMLTDRGLNLKIDLHVSQYLGEYVVVFKIRDNATAERSAIVRGKKRVTWHKVFSEEVIAPLQAQGFSLTFS